MKLFTVVETFDGVKKTYLILANTRDEAKDIIIKSLKSWPKNIGLREELNAKEPSVVELQSPEGGIEDYLAEDLYDDEDEYDGEGY